MKATKPLLLTITLAAVALAGCSDDPVTGEVSSTTSGLKVTGSIAIVFQPFYNPHADPAIPEQIPVDEYCALADADPTGALEKCIPASTTATVTISDMTNPGEGSTYNVAFIANGTVFRDLGALTRTDDAYSLEWSFEENLQNQFDQVQIRYGDYPLAIASASGGAFEVNPLARATFEAMYEGKDLTFNATGLLPGIGYTAWLVQVDDETGAIHAESFSVSEGENTYTAQKSLDRYDEIRLHMGATDIAVAVGTIS